MKLAAATLALVAVPALAFAPASNARFGVRTAPLSMSTETEAETEKAFAKLPASVKPGVV
eukprot:CAMPEP_0183290498 /NCGR_PEP_ID=MMETSP0160_2-20130417/139_1 /TAXON_ID=2839 ORGANISM="Odontella Sinensis, Strain Grunow 1884" /NCGR_SAMPLE_ID=MMETSP0160_2 /ASSEMBLY_ACC=CAM_ASM_000250 /LENGTH=59 /DNA_ID=CAMNT_0025451109 /DNA_START=23 /DNA_END=198 /DNA_ORIENTATION=+